MKFKSNFFLAITTATFFSLSANAQVREYELRAKSQNYFDAGVRAGANMQQLSAFPFTTDYQGGFFAGGYATRRTELLGVQLEANVSMAPATTVYPVGHMYNVVGDHFADTTTKGKFNTAFLNIPLSFEIRFSKHFSFLMGAQYSMLLSCKDDNGVFTKRYGTEDILKSANVSLISGFQLDMYKDLNIGARYVIGTSNMNNDKFTPFTDAWHISSGQVYLSYRLTKFGMKY